MSNTATRNLNKEKIQQILASVGSQEGDGSDGIEAAEYNWCQPHHFSSAQLKKLECFTERVARSCARKFTELYHSDFNVTITSTTQHFAHEFADTNSAQGYYYLAVGTEDQTFGLVGMPSQAAIILVTQLLGDSKSAENSDRDLSQLEQSLLFDIASGIIEAFSNSCDNYDLHPAGEIARSQMPIELEGTEEFCKIALSVKKSDSETSSDAYFLIFCEKTDPIVGENVQTGEDFSAQDISKAMLDHVQQIPVSVSAQLASIVLTFEEIMSLEVDDILLFDKKVDEPAELIVEGRTLLRGRPVQSDGKHAVQITELCGPK